MLLALQRSEPQTQRLPLPPASPGFEVAARCCFEECIFFSRMRILADREELKQLALIIIMGERRRKM